MGGGGGSYGRCFAPPAPVANPLLKGQERGLSRTSDLSLYNKVCILKSTSFFRERREIEERIKVPENNLKGPKHEIFESGLVYCVIVC